MGLPVMLVVLVIVIVVAMPVLVSVLNPVEMFVHVQVDLILIALLVV